MGMPSTSTCVQAAPGISMSGWTSISCWLRRSSTPVTPRAAIERGVLVGQPSSLARKNTPRRTVEPVVGRVAGARAGDVAEVVGRAEPDQALRVLLGAHRRRIGALFNRPVDGSPQRDDQ